MKVAYFRQPMHNVSHMPQSTTASHAILSLPVDIANCLMISSASPSAILRYHGLMQTIKLLQVPIVCSLHHVFNHNDRVLVPGDADPCLCLLGARDS